jgi:hypothetical protein
MDNFTDSNGKPVYIDASKVTHVSIDGELGLPVINFIGGSSTIVVDNLNIVLGVVKLEGALS